MKRVFVGGMHHESDTFNPIVTSRDDIWVNRGKELLESKGRSSVNGVMDTLRANGYQVIPGLIARAVPNGEWDTDYFLELKNEFVGALKAALPVDALCLSLHGSMRVKGIGAAEGLILEEMRKLCPDVPIISSLDMHATVTARMIRNADAFVGYKCAPHTDTYETGVLAASITMKTLEDGVVPRMAAVHIPFIIAGEQSETSVHPMKELTDLLRQYEKKPGILGASYLMGFPWADVAENGVTALVVAENQELADRAAQELAHVFWDTRHEFKFYNETREVPEAIQKTWESIQEGVFPVVLSDSGDNPTAGSSQDVTNFLKAIIKDGRLVRLDPPLCYQGIYDPEFCAKAIKARKGNTVTGNLGASFDKVTSSPIKVNGGLVKSVVKGFKDAMNCDLALVDVEGIDVVVTSKHVGCYDPEMMRALGVEPENCRCIVVKLGYLEPEIRAIAKRSIMVLTDGSTNEIFTRLPYRNIVRPLFPLDLDAACSFDFIGR